MPVNPLEKHSPPSFFVDKDVARHSSRKNHSLFRISSKSHSGIIPLQMEMSISHARVHDRRLLATLIPPSPICHLPAPSGSIDHGSRVSLRSSSQLIARMYFQRRIAAKTSFFVIFFFRCRRYTRRSNIPCPIFSHVKTSPGAASGSTTRFLASAVSVIVGLSHRARSRASRDQRSEVRDHSPINRFPFGS